jgi:heme/copper-type cytochrome/quinol oxidase subunit 2
VTADAGFFRPAVCGPMPKTKPKVRGLTSVEALLVAAAFIIVGVIGLLTFQNMGKSAAESLRANAIVTADKAGFDVTVEVLNGRLSAVYLAYGESSNNNNLGNPTTGKCIVVRDGRPQTDVDSDKLPTVVAGQSVTCRFQATSPSLTPGKQYTYVVYAVDASSGKVVQIAKGVITVGIA